MRSAAFGSVLALMVLAAPFTRSQQKEGEAAPEKKAVQSLDDLKKQLGKEGWVAESSLPVPDPGLPVGFDKKELAAGVEVHPYWIANPAIPIRSLTLRKGVKEKLTFKGLSVEKETVVVLPRRDNGDLELTLSKTPVCYDRESNTSYGLTFKAPSMDEEVKVVLVEGAIRIRIRGVEQQYFTGSVSVMVFEKAKAKEQKKAGE